MEIKTHHERISVEDRVYEDEKRTLDQVDERSDEDSEAHDLTEQMEGEGDGVRAQQCRHARAPDHRV